MPSVRRSTSTNTGRAPQYAIALTVRDERERLRDHAVAALHAGEQQRDVQRGRAVDGGDGARAAGVFADLAFEAVHVLADAGNEASSRCNRRRTRARARRRSGRAAGMASCVPYSSCTKSMRRWSVHPPFTGCRFPSCSARGWPVARTSRSSPAGRRAGSMAGAQPVSAAIFVLSHHRRNDFGVRRTQAFLLADELDVAVHQLAHQRAACRRSRSRGSNRC